MTGIFQVTSIDQSLNAISTEFKGSKVTFYQGAGGIGLLSSELATILHGKESKGSYEDSVLYAVDLTFGHRYTLNQRQVKASAKAGVLETRGRKNPPIVVSLQALECLLNFSKYRNNVLIKGLIQLIRSYLHGKEGGEIYGVEEDGSANVKQRVSSELKECISNKESLMKDNAKETVKDNVVYIMQNRCITDSRKLAEVFGKQHKDVLRKIESQLADMPTELRERNFTLTSQLVDMPNNATREDKIYEMTKDGFMAVAMTFTGKKAEAFRWAIIEEFNRRGDELEVRGLVTHSMEDLLDKASAEIRLYKNRASKAEQEAKVLDFKVKQQQNEAASNALKHGITGAQLYRTECLDLIRRSQEFFKENKYDPYKYRQNKGAWITLYLKYGLHLQNFVISGRRKNFFDRNEVINALQKEGIDTAAIEGKLKDVAMEG